VSCPSPRRGFSSEGGLELETARHQRRAGSIQRLRGEVRSLHRKRANATDAFERSAHVSVPTAPLLRLNRIVRMASLDSISTLVDTLGPACVAM